MTKNKSTKRALLLSALSLLLCVSMLVGSTFAWFTDSVTSGQNKIQSGNLDVELYYTYDAAVAADVNSTAWVKVTKDTDVFGYNLWEPGYTKVAYFKIANEGSLELKYQLAADVYEEKPGVNQAGAEFLLSDYIKTALVNVGTTRNQILAMEGTPLKNSYDMSKGSLAANGTAVVGLAIWMPTTVTNVANHDGKTVPEITFGIKLLATQKDAESDSFGSDYDKEAWVDGMKVYNAADLVSALANDDKVVLLNDIETTDVIELKKDVAINLNGKTLTASLDVSDDVEISIENGTIANANKNVSGIQVNKGDVTLENVEISSARHGVRVEGGNVTINGGTYKTTGGNGLTQHALNVSDGANVTVNGGIFIGPKSTGADSGAAVNVQAGSTVTINGGNFSNGLNNTLAGAGDLIVKGGTFDQNPAAYVATGYETKANADGTYTVAMKSETLTDLFANVQNGGSVTLPEGTYTIPAAVAGKNITIEGIGKGTVIDFTKVNNVGNASITFKNLHIQGKNENVMNGYGIQHTTGDIVYEDCTFDGAVTGEYYGTVTYKNCTFTGVGYITTYALKSATFENCVFDKADSRAVLVYSHGNNPCVVTINGCDFKAAKKAYTWSGDWTAAIEVDTTNIPSVGTSVAITDCTYDANYSGLVRDKSAAGKANAVITVDGKFVVHDQASLKAALSTESEEIAIIVNKDISIDIGTGWKMGGTNTKTITIDGNGKTVTLSSTYRSYFNLANPEGQLILKNMALTNTHKGTHFFDYTTHFNCDVIAKDVVFAKSPLVTDGAKAVFTDCEFSQTGTDIYGLWIMSGTDVTVNGGELKTDRGFKIADEDSAEEKTFLHVTGTKFNNTKKAAILVTTNFGAEITLSNVDISNCTADSTNAVWIDDGRTATANKISVTGGSVIIEP